MMHRFPLLWLDLRRALAYHAEQDALDAAEDAEAAPAARPPSGAARFLDGLRGSRLGAEVVTYSED